MPKAVILLSGGLDSATVMAIARQQGFECYALSFQYGQRHSAELHASKRVAGMLNAKLHRVFPLELDVFGGSALTDRSIAVPVVQNNTQEIPVTYVPARNTIFLSVALGWAEILDCQDIFIGVNAVDYSGYPDCRPEYIAAYESMANLATRMTVEGANISIHTPLIDLSKAEIIQKGVDLGLDYSITVSCYQADEEGRACGECDSCRFRKQGFAEARVPDPTVYQS